MVLLGARTKIYMKTVDLFGSVMLGSSIFLGLT